MTIQVDINGFGRIGRNVLRSAVQNFSDIEIVGSNDLLQPDYLKYMSQYHSLNGRFKAEVSVVDLTCELNSATTMAEICAEMKAQSEGALKGILGYTEDKVVATDFRGDARTSIFDADASIALDSTFVKIVAWYDNEWGYSNKCLEMVRVLGEAL